MLLSTIEHIATGPDIRGNPFELVSLLAKPLRLALQQQRQEMADMIMDMLARHVVSDQCGALADALLLLAYQVGCCPVLRSSQWLDDSPAAWRVLP